MKKFKSYVENVVINVAATIVFYLGMIYIPVLSVGLILLGLMNIKKIFLFFNNPEIFTKAARYENNTLKELYLYNMSGITRFIQVSIIVFTYILIYTIIPYDPSIVLFLPVSIDLFQLLFKIHVSLLIVSHVFTYFITINHDDYLNKQIEKKLESEM